MLVRIDTDQQLLLLALTEHRANELHALVQRDAFSSKIEKAQTETALRLANRTYADLQKRAE